MAIKACLPLVRVVAHKPLHLFPGVVVVARLSPIEEKRETVLLYYFFDMSEREIAKFCNLSRTTVQSRRTSSMKLLKRYLEEKAYDCTD